ncbi:hypothetical protein [Mycobacterium branderi]|uniref:Uncharacterized protein n=1 Tax=Mycobacterium branderi TaxID=43348 RepID=A0A7I7WFG2_9MYCO|nr:hypothetical protein [Mycobacterium branderi]MCV7236357.1 hypothetical protein [Mycobacterium branderi]ORA35519.1 hypothetical protein BST20_18230 [Mycobacterium branderi]BBZ15243.1 hypothetical protein MBRA_54380 [Mycobacterium branderi]
MTSAELPPIMQPMATSVPDLLSDEEDVQDIAALPADATPTWLQQLSEVTTWQPVRLPHNPQLRLAVHGTPSDGSWQAAETLSVFRFTGSPLFADLLSNSARTLRNLHAAEITTKMMRVPPVQGVAALRSAGTITFGERRVWVQLSHYLIGSEEPLAGRLIVHGMFVDTAWRAQLAATVTARSDAVHRGFVAAVRDAQRSG